MIQSWLVEGMGHAWSGGDRVATRVPIGAEPTDAMLDFLLGRE